MISEETAKRIADALERLTAAVEQHGNPLWTSRTIDWRGTSPTVTKCALCGQDGGHHTPTCPSRWHAYGGAPGQTT